MNSVLEKLEKEIKNQKLNESKKPTTWQEYHIRRTEFNDVKIVKMFESSIIFQSGKSFYCIEKNPTSQNNRTIMHRLECCEREVHEVPNPNYKPKKSTTKKVASSSINKQKEVANGR